MNRHLRLIVGDPVEEVRVPGEGVMSEPTRRELIGLTLFAGGLTGFVAGCAFGGFVVYKMILG